MLSKLAQNAQNTWARLNRNKSFRFGAPFFLIVIGSSFGLKYYTSLRYEYRATQKLNPKEFEKDGIEMKPPGSVTLESEFEKLKNIDTDNWENIRGPRPWEENAEYEEVKRKQQAERAAARKKAKELENVKS